MEASEPGAEPTNVSSVETVGWGGILDCSAVEDAPQQGRNHQPEGSWEVMATSNKASPQWRRKTEKGYGITFVMDSGTAKTMAPRNMVPGLKP